MEDNTRISVVGIIIEDRSSAEQVNELLHQYGDYIIGRMGRAWYTRLCSPKHIYTAKARNSTHTTAYASPTVRLRPAFCFTTETSFPLGYIATVYHSVA